MGSESKLTRRAFLGIASGGVAGTLLLGNTDKAYAESPGERRTIEDSLGRSVSVPCSISSVWPRGVYAQAILCQLYPQKMTAVHREIEEGDCRDYVDAGLGWVPSLSETVEEAATDGLADAPDVVIDVGMQKEGLRESLDAEETQMGVPHVFVDISFGNLPAAYRFLGNLLGCSARAEVLASYVESVYAETSSLCFEGGSSRKVFYAPRHRGLQVSSSISVQLDALHHIGVSPITSPYNFDERSIDLMKVMGEMPDLVVFDDLDAFDSLTEFSGEILDIWSAVPSVMDGRFACSPALLHSWFGSALLLQGIGLLWICSVICPDTCSYDIGQRAKEFYELFYDLRISDFREQPLVGQYREDGYADEQ